MTVTEAIKTRSSIRAFKPDMVDRALLMEIFELAARTPSWGNTQPWEVFVADGDALGRIRAAYIENHEKKVSKTRKLQVYLTLVLARGIAARYSRRYGATSRSIPHRRVVDVSRQTNRS